MKRSSIIICILLLLCALCVTCDHIGEDERLIYVEPVVNPVDTTTIDTPESIYYRSVLIEDFTGQRCVNCPEATKVIHSLQEAYGDSNVVAVAIHSGFFAKSASGKPYPMATEIGDEYYNYWKLDHQPVGLVNRHSPSDYPDWATQTYNQLKETARVRLTASVRYDATIRTLNVDIHSTAFEDINGKLQVWLIEDSITAFQYQPDGTNNKEYVHNHVFRDAVNGKWGTDFSITVGETQEQTFTYTIPDDKLWTATDPVPANDVPKYWVPEHMHVVVFVYTEGGVEQVVAVPIVN